MRIRSIKPEFWRSEDVSALSYFDRLLFIGLWSYVDDSGTGLDRVSVIAADLFADDLSRHPRDTLASIAAGLDTLAACGLIVRFTNGGKDFLEVTNWGRHQRVDRPNKKRYPSVGDEGSVIRDGLATPSRVSREIPAPGTGEQGNRGTGEQEKILATDADAPIADRPSKRSAGYSDEFESWWSVYPRKAGKRKAATAFVSARKRATLDELIAGARRYADDPNRVDEFTRHGATWLNGDGWLDEPEPVRSGRRSPVEGPSWFDTAAELDGGADEFALEPGGVVIEGQWWADGARG